MINGLPGTTRNAPVRFPSPPSPPDPTSSRCGPFSPVAPNPAAHPQKSNSALIHLGDNIYALVDADLLLLLSRLDWKPRRWWRCTYAYAKLSNHPRAKSIAMHRFVARTPTGMVCHHRNRNSLDNRSRNLLNMTKKDHHFLHQNNSLLITRTGNWINLDA